MALLKCKQLKPQVSTSNQDKPHPQTAIIPSEVIPLVT